MRQLISSLKTGALTIVEVPAPSVSAGELLLRTRRTLVSQGTEKMLIEFGRASLFQKARSQPSRVRQVLAKIRTDGLTPTLSAVFRRLDEPIVLGYCHVGEVIAVGPGVTGFAVGDRVASNGPHAEYVAVPVNLAAKIPDGVSDDAAAFTVAGAIALHGIRLAHPEFGEVFVIIGLGLMGQLAAQLLRGMGCRVIGFDLDQEKVNRARELGAEAFAVGQEIDPIAHVFAATRGVGADGVIITASSSANRIIAESAQMSRKRGRIILIGVIGLQLNRADFYEKEISFQVSCSYGPGRYEDIYEEKGSDYPLAYVRWTENRNFQAVLNAMAAGTLRVESLVTRCVPLERFDLVYTDMAAGGLASLFTYPTESGTASITRLRAPAIAGPAALAVIGAGNFAKMTALPALVSVRAPIKAIISASGVTGTMLARRYAIPVSASDLTAVLDDPEIGGVIITTRHNLHASQTIAALRAGKQVLVEKPLCLDEDELNQIIVALGVAPAGASIMVGYNRRFSVHAQSMRELIGSVGGPICFIANINAGVVAPNHWVSDLAVGGGRLLGEACHFIDLAIFLSGSEVQEVTATALDGAADTFSILLRHANGSTGAINYFANGNRAISKERIEVHLAGRTLILDNFRTLAGYGFRSFSRLKTRQDKGHAQLYALFTKSVAEGGSPLIPWNDIVNSTRAAFAGRRALADRSWNPV